VPGPSCATRTEDILAAVDIATRELGFALPESDFGLVAARSLRAVAVASLASRSGDSTVVAAGTAAEFNAP
jgi:hypothetical protein